MQPRYPESGMEKSCLEQIISLLDSVKSADIIAVPEYANIPGLGSPEEFLPVLPAQTAALEAAVKRAAIRCKALVSVNMLWQNRNVTRLFSPEGEELFDYKKQHLTLAETDEMLLDGEYRYSPRGDNVYDFGGLKIGFLTCYDIYFDEYICALARQKPDIVILSSYQRGERADIISAQAVLLATRCNAAVLRASYATGRDTGGCGMAVGCDGRIIENMGQRVGLLECDISPENKYMRPNGFGHPPIGSDEFVERGRTPSVCRPCGPYIIRGNALLRCPRLSAVGGASPLPTFGAAIAVGADEITFDLIRGEGGQPTLCDGTALERLLERFTCQAIFDIRLGDPDIGLAGETVRLLRRYDCDKHARITAESGVLRAIWQIAPEIERCLIAENESSPIETAKRRGCGALRFSKESFTPQTASAAHDGGLRCVCRADGENEAKRLLADGADVIITDDVMKIINILGRNS